MDKLIRLEVRRNKLTPYYTALAVIGVIMVGFLYLIATIAKVEGVIEFTDYENILKMHTGITFIIFSVFSVVIYSKFVIEEYSYQRAILLFSYPVSRTKIFMAKLILVIGFITVGFLTVTLIPNALFFMTEQVWPIIGGDVTLGLIGLQLIKIAAFILAMISIGFISLRIGFINKSVSTTIITAVILSSLMGNVLIGLGTNGYILIGVVLLFGVGVGFAVSTNNVIRKMEV